MHTLKGLFDTENAWKSVCVVKTAPMDFIEEPLKKVVTERKTQKHGLFY